MGLRNINYPGKLFKTGQYIFPFSTHAESLSQSLRDQRERRWLLFPSVRKTSTTTVMYYPEVGGPKDSVKNCCVETVGRYPYNVIIHYLSTTLFGDFKIPTANGVYLNRTRLRLPLRHSFSFTPGSTSTLRPLLF